MIAAILTTTGELTTGLGSGPASTALLVLAVPVVALTVVLTWHGLRGTNPGPAPTQLLKLVELLLFRRRDQ